MKENEEMGLLEVTKFVMDPAHHGGTKRGQGAHR
jgi:hypothetical protein